MSEKIRLITIRRQDSPNKSRCRLRDLVVGDQFRFEDEIREVWFVVASDPKVDKDGKWSVEVRD